MSPVDRPFWWISDKQSNLTLPNLMPLAKNINFFLRWLWCCSRGTLSSKCLIPRPSIDSKDSTEVSSITRYRELPVSITPFVEEVPDGFADLILAILAVMTCSSDSVDGSGFSLILKKNFL